ncbi:adenosylhomocysteinase [Sesbania bispinosa]|nr:adenosylhomocysteinase [Sesbania bispinosa]
MAKKKIITTIILVMFASMDTVLLVDKTISGQRYKMNNMSQATSSLRLWIKLEEVEMLSHVVPV